MSLPLLPDRDCGGCVECCRVIPLNLPELAKPTGELCAYCVDGAGCAVHAIRPNTCRIWFCLWRVIELDERWRPDRSGVIVRPDGIEDGIITRIEADLDVASAEVVDGARRAIDWLHSGQVDIVLLYLALPTLLAPLLARLPVTALAGVATALWAAAGGSPWLVGVYLTGSAVLTLIALWLSKETKDVDYDTNIGLGETASL